MKIGIHTSSSGSLEKAGLKAHELGANCFQIFSGSPRTWAAPPPDPAAVARMKEVRERLKLAPLVIHANYLINLCSIDEANRPKSVKAFRGEVERALVIGAEYLVVHPGSCKGQTSDAAIAEFSKSLVEACEGIESDRLTILLENTAGQGNVLGSKLGELAEMKALVRGLGLAVGYCIDTCHAYAAGYDVSTEDGLEELIAEGKKTIGWENVPVIHTNDSKGTLGSKLDRHANIGEGYIKSEGFRRILNHRVLRDKAFILETPIDNEGDDRKNVDALWSLVKKNARKNV